MDRLHGQLEDLHLGSASVVQVISRERTDQMKARLTNSISGDRNRFRHLSQRFSKKASSVAPAKSFIVLTPSGPHQCTSDACSVSKVFGTPELLANVLSCLPTRDVAAVRQVNKTFAGTVAETPGLRLSLFVNPQWLRPPADFMLLDLKLPGLSIRRGEPVEKGQWILISLNATAAAFIAPPSQPSRRPRALLHEGLRGGLGSRSQKSGTSWPSSEQRHPLMQYGDLHITQPPVLGVQAFMLSEDGHESPVHLPSSSTESAGVGADNVPDDEQTEVQRACAKLSCDAGITLDFVAETALSLLSEKGATHNDDGSEKMVLFKAIVSFGEPARSFRKRGTARSVIRLG